MQGESPHRVEGLLRTAVVELGLRCADCAKPLTGDVIKKYVVPNTISQAWYFSLAVHRAKRSKTDLVEIILTTTTGRLLFTGKIIDVSRSVGKGYTMGSVLLALLKETVNLGIEDSADTNQRHMLIPFQNEFLYAIKASAAGQETGDIVCTIPDLKSILGENGEAIGCQRLCYGLLVSVITMPAHSLWTSETALKVGGPEGFGLKMSFTSVDEYRLPRSVIEELEDS